MRKPLVMGNWKMHGSTEMVQVLLNGLKPALSACKIETAIFPPYVYLPMTRDLLQNGAVGFGAQNVSLHDQGAFTGEVSAAMLRDIGVEYVLVGHSERRQYHQESNGVVAGKFINVVACDMIPVLCVGETLPQREQGQTEDVVAAQVKAVLEKVTLEQMQQSVIAYEPVWAIGTGLAATPAQAQAVHAFIRSLVSDWSQEVAKTIRIVYGGSVNQAMLKNCSVCQISMVVWLAVLRYKQKILLTYVKQLHIKQELEKMESIILIIHVFIALSLIGLVLLQQGKGAQNGRSIW